MKRRLSSVCDCHVEVFISHTVFPDRWNTKKSTFLVACVESVSFQQFFDFFLGVKYHKSASNGRLSRTYVVSKKKKRALNLKWPIIGHVTNLKSIRVWPEVIDFCPKIIKLLTHDHWDFIIKDHWQFDPNYLHLEPKSLSFWPNIIEISTSKSLIIGPQTFLNCDFDPKFS